MCNNSFVIGWILDAHTSPKLCASGLNANPDPPGRCTQLRAFAFPDRTPSEITGPAWAARKETQAIDSPRLRLAAFFRGTAQVVLYMVRRAGHRWNLNLKGLWALAGSGMKAFAYHPWATYGEMK